MVITEFSISVIDIEMPLWGNESLFEISLTFAKREFELSRNCYMVISVEKFRLLRVKQKFESREF